jgi:hypothetical protein
VSRAARPLAVLVALAALTATAGCGSDSAAVRAEKIRIRQFEPPSPGSLAWSGTPLVIRNPRLPRDTVVSGHILDRGLNGVKLHSRQVRVQDGHGNRVDAAATFLQTYVHPLYPWDRPPPGGLTEYELERTGFLRRIAPGRTAPLTVSWRLKPGQSAPTEIVFDGAALPVPKG